MWFFRKKQQPPINQPSGNQPRKEGEFREGDVIYIKRAEEYWPYKILRIETWPDNSKVWHVRVYEKINYQPSPDDVKKFEVFSHHGPHSSFEKEANFIINLPVTEEELSGYYSYRKHTDFIRYAEETGQTVEDLAKKAHHYYALGNKLADEHKLEDAIEAYAEAVDIFPTLYEAIDNMGCAKMDLALYGSALWDFRQSLNVAPDMPIAQSNLAICYYRLGQYSKAQEEFEKYIKLQNDALGQEYLAKIRIKMSQTNPEYTNSIQDFPGYNDELPAYYGNRKHLEFENQLKANGQYDWEVIKKTHLYFNEARKLLKEKKYQEAIEAYQKANQLFPLSYKALFNQAVAKMSLNDYAEALIDLQKSIILEPNDFLSTLYLAACYYHLRDYKRSKLAAEKAGELQADKRVDDLLADVNQRLAASNPS